MKFNFASLGWALLFFASGWGASLWYEASNPPEKGPNIQTQGDQPPLIVGLEMPIRSKDGKGGNAVLKAAYADKINEKEFRVYGGFEYRTTDKVITGDEALINIVTGSTRQMKGIKIYEK